MLYILTIIGGVIFLGLAFLVGVNNKKYFTYISYDRS